MENNDWGNISRRLLRLFLRYIFPFIFVGLIIVILHSTAFGRSLSPYVFMSLIVIIQTIIGGGISGYFTAFLTSIGAYYFLTQPYDSLKFDNTSVSQLIIFFSQFVFIVFIFNKYIKNLTKTNLRNKLLKTSQKKLRSIIDNVSNSIIIIDSSGKIKEANRTFAALNNNNNNWKELIGSSIYTTILWIDNASAQAKLKEAIKNTNLNRPIVYDDCLRINSLDLHYFSLSISKIDDKNSMWEGSILITGEDINERKEYERDLKIAQKNYSKIINSNIVGMVISDSVGNILEINEAFLKIINYSRTEIMNKINLFQLIFPGYINSPKAFLNQAMSNGQSGPNHKELLKKDGSSVPVLSSKILIDGKKKHYLEIVMDLTMQKELDRKKDEFISIASHELKTPLTTIKGYAQLLAENIQDRNNSNYKYIEVINRQLVKLNDIVNDLLDMSRIQSGKLILNLKKIDITQLIKNSIDEISLISLGSNPIVLANNSEETGLVVNADEVRLSQVMSNLLINAVKFSHPTDSIEVGIKVENKKIIVTVKDSGIGIAESEVSKIFDKFYQVETNLDITNKTMGLGLYISKEIITAHGGQIGLTSKLNQGSTFYFSLPIYTD